MAKKWAIRSRLLVWKALKSIDLCFVSASIGLEMLKTTFFSMLGFLLFWVQRRLKHFITWAQKREETKRHGEDNTINCVIYSFVLAQMRWHSQERNTLFVTSNYLNFQRVK